MELTEKQVINYYKNINKTDNINDCWEWKSRITCDGYGEFRFYTKAKRQYRLAHRLALKLNNIDVTGYLVLHSCDNRKCCNPNHLRCGTHQENMNDMKERGRSLKGINRRNLKNIKKEEISKSHEHNDNDNCDTSLSNT